MDKKRSLLNVCISIAFKIIVLLCTILTKRYVIRYLGNDINGLYSLYVSILGTLAVAELGVGSAITFCMYKPIVEKNTEKVSILYHLFTKIYPIVGGIILVAGLVTMPFLPTLAKGYENVGENLYFTFGLMLIATVMTYLFSSKTSLINAYKDNYITTSIISIAHIIRSILQVFSVILFNSFFAYLICEIFAVILQWTATEFVARKQHQDIIQSESRRIDKETKNEVVKNVKAMFMHKIGNVLVNTSDSLIISAFIGITILGKYSNYVLIITSAITIFSLLFTPLTSVIGHMFVESPESAKSYFGFFHSFNFVTATVLGLGYYAIVNNLIELLFDVGLDLPKSVVLIVTINYFIQFLRQAGLLFRDASGTFYYDRWKPAIEGAFNIVFSILFVKIFPEEYNVVGVIVATIITNLLICHIIEPYVLYRHAFKSSVKPYLLKNYSFVIIFIIALFVLDRMMLTYDSVIKELLVNGFISVGISIVVFIGVLIADKQFRNYTLAAVKTVLKIKDFQTTKPREVAMKRTKEELQHIFEAKIDRLEDLVKEAMSYDVESEKRMMIALDIAVVLRAILGASNGGTLISKTGYNKEIIFPFYNTTEPLNLLPTYLLVSDRIQDSHITFASEVDMKKERVPVVYLSYDSWIDEAVVNYKRKDYEPLSRLKVIKILADTLGAHVDSKIDKYAAILRESNVMPTTVKIDGQDCTVNCENLLTETVISIAKELIFAYKHYFDCKLKRIGVESKAHFYKIKYTDPVPNNNMYSNSYIHSTKPLDYLQSYCDTYFGGEAEDIIVGIYRMHYLKSAYYEVKLIDK